MYNLAISYVLLITALLSYPASLESLIKHQVLAQSSSDNSTNSNGNNSTNSTGNNSTNSNGTSPTPLNKSIHNHGSSYERESSTESTIGHNAHHTINKVVEHHHVSNHGQGTSTEATGESDNGDDTLMYVAPLGNVQHYYFHGHFAQHHSHFRPHREYGK
jgi:hypothetical protein